MLLVHNKNNVNNDLGKCNIAQIITSHVRERERERESMQFMEEILLNSRMGIFFFHFDSYNNEGMEI